MTGRIRKRRWLWDFLREYAAGYDPAAARRALPPDCFDPEIAPWSRGKHAVRRLMRASGLRYGTPIDASGIAAEDPTRTDAEALFLTALGRELDLCGAVVLVFAVELGPLERERDLLALLAALLGEDRVAERLTSRPLAEKTLEREARGIAGRLRRRGEALMADPASGLPLHNGLLYCDARFLGRMAIHYYKRRGYSARAASRLRGYMDRERAALAEALLLLARADHAPSGLSRRIMLRQLRALGLPRPAARRLQSAVETPRPPEEIARAISSPRTRRFVLEQVVLGSLADGWRSPRERHFLQRLAETLGIPQSELAAIEAELAEFYAGHPEFVDRFQLRDRLGDLTDQALVTVGRFVERNRAVFLHEVRQGRELSHALATLARGNKLDAEQRRRLREQLLDLAKTVPGLALFAAPGGLLLVLALSKILPPSLLPSALTALQADDDGPSRGESAEGETTPESAPASPASRRASSGLRRS
ncbi:MAG: TerB family tellurite resistance protein [Deltaproteobacteria bacterium]